MRDDLRHALAGGAVLLADGGIGTELMRRGFRLGECPELWNRERPADVRAVHDAYAAAGAQLLTTDSFGGHPMRLALHGLDAACEELNRRAAELARGAAGDERWVIGSLGPCGRVLAPLGDADPDAVRAGFERQARALLAGGADLLLLETVTALDELAAAVAALRAAGGSFVGASFAFDLTRRGEIRTMMGVDVATAVRAAVAAGVDLVGANCGRRLGPAELAPVVRQLADESGLPVLVEPNAGTPEPTSGLHPLGPSVFAAHALELVAAGARIVGGCCGTTPEHVAALRAALGGGRDSRDAPRASDR
ncbi:MAG: homocysteine S-methyltransferase family protein [Planctomycetes bacterium]|nr:homocysteine S-methyltransferase family protein [Planctomycetota bacterium]